MLDTMTRYLAAFGDVREREALRGFLKPIVDRMSTRPLNAAGLLVSGTGSGVTAKIGSADFYASVTGKLVKIAASTDMPALVGTITQSSYNVFCFFVDAAGTVTSAIGTEATTLAGVVFPTFPQNKALVGFIIVTYAGGLFTGGSTGLSTATTVYIDGTGMFDPSVLI